MKWQPIETAPKDGALVLLFVPGSAILEIIERLFYESRYAGLLLVLLGGLCCAMGIALNLQSRSTGSEFAGIALVGVGILVPLWWLLIGIWLTN